ncbi:MAG TPA: TetR/AcrR family transcriptional regulator [Jatrophihabitantaceae bacterium]|nr:TetR/AcrR family transcriptional regulator [Jatrophihabitantaceae bacterium]
MASSRSPQARRRLSVDARRGAILEAASRVIAEHGPDSTSVEDVALAAGASPALVHHYFGTRQDLIDHTLRRAADELLQRLRLDHRTPAAEQLAVGLTIYLDYVAEHSDSWVALLRAGRPGSDNAALIAAEVDEHAYRLAVRAVFPGRARPPAALTAALRGWIALVKECCLHWIEDGTLHRAALQALLSASFVGCVQAAAAADPSCQPALDRLVSTSP